MLRWFYASCIIFVVCVYAFTNTWPISTLLNVTYYALEQNEKWWREWIGALSGWAGATAAGITLFTLYQQLNNQRKQTAYAVGEAEPDFLIERNSDQARCNLKVVNYSRHNIVVDRISVIAPRNVDVSGFFIDGDYYPYNTPRFLVRGNLGRIDNTRDRSLTVLIYEPSAVKNVDISTCELTLHIEYRKIGQKHTKHTAKAYALSYKTR